jgi:hypothetical protein
MPLEPTEDILRAVCTDKWDGQRLSPSLFTGKDISVSRPALIPLADHWDLFRQYVQKPPERWLERIAQINIGRLQAIGHAHNPHADITVEAKPVDWNPAHAEIPQNITRGLANKILPALTLHDPPANTRP